MYRSVHSEYYPNPVQKSVFFGSKYTEKSLSSSESKSTVGLRSPVALVAVGAPVAPATERAAAQALAVLDWDESQPRDRD